MEHFGAVPTRWTVLAELGNIPCKTGFSNMLENDTQWNLSLVKSQPRWYKVTGSCQFVPSWPSSPKCKEGKVWNTFLTWLISASHSYNLSFRINKKFCPSIQGTLNNPDQLGWSVGCTIPYQMGTITPRPFEIQASQSHEIKRALHIQITSCIEGCWHWADFFLQARNPFSTLYDFTTTWWFQHCLKMEVLSLSLSPLVFWIQFGSAETSL